MLVLAVGLATAIVPLIQFRESHAATPHELTGLDVVRTKYGFRGAGQTVAIIDSGVAYDHLALGGGFGPNHRVVAGWDFAENDSNPYDDGPAGSHGTHVAGIVAAADGPADVGVAPGADLVALRVFNDAGGASLDWLESALRWVHENRNAFAYPITAVNLSVGAGWNSDVPPPSATLEEELSQLEADGIFVSAAAGNNFAGFSAPGLDYPAASPHVVPVMSVDDNGQLSFFSQRLSRAIGAPGRLINSTVPDYAGNRDGVPIDFALRQGTDMSAAYVTGASVLVREAMGMVGNTNVSQQTIYDHMLATADSIFDSATEQYYRRLNLQAAIDALIPADDYGSTADAAHDWGSVGAGTHFAGLIADDSDVDFFGFTAATTGTALVSTTASYYLDPVWTVADGNIPLTVDGGGNLMVFPVTAGRRYTLGLSSQAGAGRFDGMVSVSTSPFGDYNRDGVASTADYTVWRNTLGSTDDLRADGDRSGKVDLADYALWKLMYRPKPLSAIPGDFNRDGMVSAADYTVWRNTLGSITDLRADANLNGMVDQSDYAIWKAAFTGSTIGKIAGDFNRDGVVSAADYTVWRNTLGSQTDLRADANLNGIVDQNDYGLWKQYFSQSRAPLSSASTAPEPSCGVSLLSVLLLTLLARRSGRLIGVRAA